MAHLVALILLALVFLFVAALATVYGARVWQGSLLLVLFLVFTPYHVLGAYRFFGVLRKLRELGWNLTVRDLFSGISQIRDKDLKYVMRKEDFLVTPRYRSDRRDIHNLLACIEFSKREEQSRSAYAPLRPYIEEHDRERTNPPR